MQLNLFEKNVMKSQKFNTFTKQITNAYAYIDDKKMIPAGSPYPHQGLAGVNMITASKAGMNYLPTKGTKAYFGPTLRIGEEQTHKTLPTFTLSKVANSLDANHDLLNIHYQTLKDGRESKVIMVTAKMEEIILPGTYFTLSFDIQCTEEGVLREVQCGTAGSPSDDFFKNEPELGSGGGNFYSTRINGSTELKRISITNQTHAPNPVAQFYLHIVIPANGIVDTNIRIGRLQLEKGKVASAYKPSPAEGGMAPEESDMPQGLIFTDICADDNEDHTREGSLMTSGKVIEAKLPIPLTPMQKSELIKKGIQFF